MPTRCCRYSGKDLSLLLMRIRHAAAARSLESLAAASERAIGGSVGDADGGADGGSEAGVTTLTVADVAEALADHVPASMAGVKTEKADVSFGDVGG